MKDSEYRGRRRIVVDEFTRSCIRSEVHHFYTQREIPAVEKIFERCKSEIENFPDMSRSTFWKIFRAIGFRYVKTKGNTKLMVERNDIVACSHRYLRRIRKFGKVAGPLFMSMKRGSMPIIPSPGSGVTTDSLKAPSSLTKLHPGKGNASSYQ